MIFRQNLFSLFNRWLQKIHLVYKFQQITAERLGKGFMNYNQHNFYKNNRDCAEAQVDISYK